MLVFLDARLTHYTGGGIARYMREMAAALPALAPGDDFGVLQMWKQRETLAMPANARRVNCFTPAHHRLERLALGVELWPRAMGQKRPTLLHSMDFVPPYLPGDWVRVITIHDLTFLHYPQFLTAESRRYYNDQIEWAAKTADAIVTDSEATRQDVLARLNVAADKVTTVHLGVDARFAPADADAVAALLDILRIPRGYILFVGTFEPRKNIAGLVRAYAALVVDVPDAPPLVLAGRPGWLFAETEALIESLAVRDRIVIVEGLADEWLPALYSAARMLVLPSFYEGFGFPPLEAMACGTAVIVSDRASLPEIVGDAGLVVAAESVDGLADAMRRVLMDDDLAADLQARGLTQAAGFRWTRCAAQTLAVYRLAAAR